MKIKLLALVLSGGILVADDAVNDNIANAPTNVANASTDETSVYGVVGFEAGLKSNIIFSQLISKNSTVRDSDRNLGVTAGFTAGVEVRFAKDFGFSTLAYAGGGQPIGSELIIQDNGGAVNAASPIFTTHYGQFELGVDAKLTYYSRRALAPYFGVGYRHLGFESYNNTFNELLNGGSLASKLITPISVSKQEINTVYPLLGLNILLSDFDMIYLDYRFAGALKYKSKNRSNPININTPLAHTYTARSAYIENTSYLSVGYQHKF